MRTFPYDRSKLQARKRTSQECMNNAVEAVNSRSVLTGMKGPSFFKYWKASVFRTWVFFYSLPILCDILDEKYFHHFASFAVRILSFLHRLYYTWRFGKKVKILLSYFVHLFSLMYGEKYVTLNMHSLLHLPECVEDVGPLWLYKYMKKQMVCSPNFSMEHKI